MNADSWKQRMAHSLVWVSSALTSLTIAIPHTVTALLKTQSHSNISLTKYAILFSANREGWAHIKPILFAPISMRGEFHNCLTAPVHCSNPVLTSKTFFFQNYWPHILCRFALLVDRKKVGLEYAATWERRKFFFAVYSCLPTWLNV